MTAPVDASSAAGSSGRESPGDAESATLLDRLRAGDSDAFASFVTEHHARLCRLAALYVEPRHVEEVVQETWMAVIVGLDRFEGRSSLRTWLFQILFNQARKRFRDERGNIPFAALAAGDTRAVVDPDLLQHPELGPGYWTSVPPAWDGDPEGRTLGREVQQALVAAVAALPAQQREVIVLRDIEGWAAEEVCDALAISAVNQRVLLHRARATVRARLVEYRRD